MKTYKHALLIFAVVAIVCLFATVFVACNKIDDQDENDFNIFVENSDDYDFELQNDDTYKIVKYNGIYSKIIIPSQYNEKPVTCIGDNAFEKCENLSDIIIPNSVTSIGKYAFSGCIKISNVTIPNSVTSIGEYAFYNCIGLLYFTMGNGVSELPRGLLTGCNAIHTITLPFVGSTKKKSHYYKSQSMLFGYVFDLEGGSGYMGARQCYDVSEDGQLQNYVYNIPSSLRNVTITGGIIEFGAFSGCDKLINVTITSDITYLSPYAFYGCTRLSNVTLPSSVTSIGERAFLGCSSLAIDKIPDGVTSIEEEAFRECNSLTDLTLPENLVRIGAYAFYKCEKLTNIKFLNTLNWYCTDNKISWNNKIGGNLENVTVPWNNATKFTSTEQKYYWYKN